MHVQDFEEVTRYIVGEYDLEILTTPRIYINDIHIDQSKPPRFRFLHLDLRLSFAMHRAMAIFCWKKKSIAMGPSDVLEFYQGEYRPAARLISHYLST
ncbi:MAG: hypothetical protein IPM91_17800 [Bacteroidetes bacterium]|nr:hypothetical protein [Bacteroidota bacterium]